MCTIPILNALLVSSVVTATGFRTDSSSVTGGNNERFEILVEIMLFKNLKPEAVCYSLWFLIDLKHLVMVDFTDLVFTPLFGLFVSQQNY